MMMPYPAIAFLILVPFAVGFVLGGVVGAREKGAELGAFIERMSQRHRDEMDRQFERHRKEIEEMARRPLTRDQLEACVKAGGNECPRCGNDEFEDGDLEFDESSEPFMQRQCTDCNEKFVVVYAVSRVESGGD
jgi:predicted nucleic-acid-binding Zn-ribbon protein